MRNSYDLPEGLSIAQVPAVDLQIFNSPICNLEGFANLPDYSFSRLFKPL